MAQLYINDPVASISQPVRRLRGFERVTLQPGQAKTVCWTLDRDDVGYYDNRGRFVVENGRINVYVGNTSSQSDNRVVHGHRGQARLTLGVQSECRGARVLPATIGSSGATRPCGLPRCRAPA